MRIRQKEADKVNQKESVFKKYPINDFDICNGWLSPGGTTFSCEEYSNNKCAEMLCKEFNIPTKGTLSADDALLKNGWIKIVYKEWCGYWDRINDIQIQVLESLYIPHRRIR